MSVNAVLVILIIVTVFPALASILLHGKYVKLVLPLAALNVLIEIAAFTTLIVLPNNCRAATYDWSRCTDHGGAYSLVSLANLVFGIVIWYLAFKRKDPSALTYNAASGPRTASQFALQNHDREGLRTFLAASGWLITVGIVAFTIFIVALFAYAFSGG
jgi:hypothetical protein